MLETFLYGDQAHANEDKRAIFDRWKEIGPMHAVLENCFEYVVGQTTKYIVWLAAKNAEGIKALEQLPSRAP